MMFNVCGDGDNKYLHYLKESLYTQMPQKYNLKSKILKN